MLWSPGGRIENIYDAYGHRVGEPVRSRQDLAVDTDDRHLTSLVLNLRLALALFLTLTLYGPTSTCCLSLPVFPTDIYTIYRPRRFAPSPWIILSIALDGRSCVPARCYLIPTRMPMTEE